MPIASTGRVCSARRVGTDRATRARSAENPRIAASQPAGGLIGIRERVKLYGGEMTTATTNGSGFTLTARLPLTEYRP
jgi:signal transduction histidine kinase